MIVYFPLMICDRVRRLFASRQVMRCRERVRSSACRCCRVAGVNRARLVRIRQVVESSVREPLDAVTLQFGDPAVGADRQREPRSCPAPHCRARSADNRRRGTRPCRLPVALFGSTRAPAAGPAAPAAPGARPVIGTSGGAIGRRRRPAAATIGRPHQRRRRDDLRRRRRLRLVLGAAAAPPRGAAALPRRRTSSGPRRPSSSHCRPGR